MTIELDEWDKDWLSRAHTPEEWHRECKDLLIRNALYFRRVLELMDQVTALKAEVERLRGQVQGGGPGCLYPRCMDGGDRCARLFVGGCAGPRLESVT